MNPVMPEAVYFGKRPVQRRSYVVNVSLKFDFQMELTMHDSRGAELKVGDRVFVECEVTELQSGADPNYCNVTIKAITPDQANPTPMVPPSCMVFNTKMLTKIGK